MSATYLGYAGILATAFLNLAAGLPEDGQRFTRTHRYRLLTGITLLGAAALLAA